MLDTSKVMVESARTHDAEQTTDVWGGGGVMPLETNWQWLEGGEIFPWRNVGVQCMCWSLGISTSPEIPPGNTFPAARSLGNYTRIQAE